jgi:transposase
MILDLHRQGLRVSDIARRSGLDRKTVRRYIARGLEPPSYTPRPPRPTLLDPYRAYLQERVAAYPELRASRLLRELRGLGYRGGYTQLTDFLRTVRPAAPAGFEQRFETAPGQQAQVDFAYFRTEFTAEPGASRVVWLFSMVLGHSRLIWARFVAHQDLQAVLRCHAAAFEAMGGVPGEVLYDRRRTAVSGENETGVVYNRSWSPAPGTTASSPGRAARIGPRARARSSDPSATCARTSSWLAAFRTSTTSTPSSGSGWTRSPTRACTPPRAGSSPSTAQTSGPTSSRCPRGRSRPCCERRDLGLGGHRGPAR